MSEQLFYNTLLIAWIILAAITFGFLFFVVAPYGRHTKSGWGPTIDNKLGWIIMEAPSPLLFAALFWLGDNEQTLPLILFFLLWQAHYIHRAFIYPLRLRSGVKSMPLIVASSGLFFNIVNAYLNGRYLFTLSDGYPTAWLTDPRFLLGLLLFLTGFIINRHADYILRNLRQPGESAYKIPHGGLYRWISCPNYLGELIEWTGWAIATSSLAGLSFALWTAANLAPRAYANHAWYKKQFPEYPKERKALIPWLW